MKSNRQANLTVALPVSKKPTNKQKTLSLNGLINGKVEIIRSKSLCFNSTCIDKNKLLSGFTPVYLIFLKVQTFKRRKWSLASKM